jgi:hypothetical protein
LLRAPMWVMLDGNALLVIALRLELFDPLLPCIVCPDMELSFPQ